MKRIHYIFFTLTYISKAFIDVLFVANDINTFNNFKYIFMICGIALLWFDKIFNEKNNPNKIRKKLFFKEYIYICSVILVFLCISMIRILISGRYTINTIMELVYLWLPVTYAYLLLNTLSEKEMDKYFNTLLLCFGIAYIVEISDKLTMANLSLISYAKSYSPFESNFMAGPALTLFLYFLYRRKKVNIIISFLFVLMTFKRLMVLFSIFILIYSIIFDIQKDVSKRTICFFKIFFVVSPIIIYYVLRPEYVNIINNQFNIDLDNILMGRYSILNTVIDSGYKSFGFGSTTAVAKELRPLDGHLHLDLIKIYLEVSIVGLIIFVNNLWKIAGTKRYAVMIILFDFFNLLTSHSLTGSFSWLLRYLILGSIVRDNYEKEKAYNDR